MRLDDAKLGQMADDYAELDVGTGNDEHLRRRRFHPLPATSLRSASALSRAASPIGS